MFKTKRQRDSSTLCLYLRLLIVIFSTFISGATSSVATAVRRIAAASAIAFAVRWIAVACAIAFAAYRLQGATRSEIGGVDTTVAVDGCVVGVLTLILGEEGVVADEELG